MLRIYLFLIIEKSKPPSHLFPRDKRVEYNPQKNNYLSPTPRWQFRQIDPQACTVFVARKKLISDNLITLRFIPIEDKHPIAWRAICGRLIKITTIRSTRMTLHSKPTEPSRCAITIHKAIGRRTHSFISRSRDKRAPAMTNFLQW